RLLAQEVHARIVSKKSHRFLAHPDPHGCKKSGIRAVASSLPADLGAAAFHALGRSLFAIPPSRYTPVAGWLRGVECGRPRRAGVRVRVVDGAGIEDGAHPARA